jgi:predicted nucleic acid-binding protein
MKSYWDTSALIQATFIPELRLRLRRESALSRTHSLAEAFSAFTGGNLTIRVNADEATAIIEDLAADLDFVDLDRSDVLAAMRTARAKGIRGGRIHDYLHAVAAEKAGADKLLTVDRNDFNDLTSLTIEQLD